MCDFFAPKFSVSLQNLQNGGGTKVILSDFSVPRGSHPPLPADQADVHGHLVTCKMQRRREMDLSFVFLCILVPCEQYGTNSA